MKRKNRDVNSSPAAILPNTLVNVYLHLELRRHAQARQCQRTAAHCPGLHVVYPHPEAD